MKWDGAEWNAVTELDSATNPQLYYAAIIGNESYRKLRSYRRGGEP